MAIINEISESSTLPRRTGEYVPGTISIDLTTSKVEIPLRSKLISSLTYRHRILLSNARIYGPRQWSN